MRKSNFNDDMGDDYSDELDVLADEQKQLQIASYVPINVSEAETAIQTSATKFVAGIVKLYHKAQKSEDKDSYFDTESAEQAGSSEEMSELIESISSIEAVNLSMLLKQVKWADHLVVTLMRRLEAGGSMDTELIEKIISAQQSAMNLTLTISNYTRTLPQYFKSLKTELEDGLVPEQNSMLSLHEPDGGMLMIEAQAQNQEPLRSQEDSEFNIRVPQKGMRDLLKNVMKARAEVKAEEDSANDSDVVDYEEV